MIPALIACFVRPIQPEPKAKRCMRTDAEPWWCKADGSGHSIYCPKHPDPFLCRHGVACGGCETCDAESEAAP